MKDKVNSITSTCEEEENCLNSFLRTSKMDACEEGHKQNENESDRKRQNPDLRFDDRISKNNTKLFGKKIKASTTSIRY